MTTAPDVADLMRRLNPWKAYVGLPRLHRIGVGFLIGVAVALIATLMS